MAREPESCVRAKSFYDDYVQWAHERGHSTLKTTMTKFGNDLRDLIDQLGNEEVSLQGALEKHATSHGNVLLLVSLPQSPSGEDDSDQNISLVEALV